MVDAFTRPVQLNHSFVVKVQISFVHEPFVQTNLLGLRIVGISQFNCTQRIIFLY